MSKLDRQVTDALRRNRRLPRSHTDHRAKGGHFVGPGTRSRRVREATPINMSVKAYVRKTLKEADVPGVVREDLEGWAKAKGMKI